MNCFKAEVTDRKDGVTMSIQLKGIGASPGLAIAEAFLLKAEDTYVPMESMVERPEAEAERFAAAVEQARQDLEQIRQSTKERLGADKAEIFEGHLMMLEDPDLIDVIIANIRDNAVNAEYALHEAAQYFIVMLEQMDDELLRERAVDVKDVCSRIMRHLRGVASSDLSAMPDECVVFAQDLTPSDTVLLDLHKVKGFVTEIGSRTSHSAIMARTLDLPAIVGVGAELRSIRSGTIVVLDASEGLLLVDPDEQEIEGYREKKIAYDRRKAELSQWKNRATLTANGRHVELAANIGKLEDVQKALDNGAEGIGLFRTEFLYMGRDELPSEEEQYNSYKYVLEKMDGKPVVIRTLDIGGDKELPYLDLPKESNPFLGQRALRLCLERPEMFRTQLRALLRSSRHGNLKIMFPMIAVVEELREAKRMLEEEKQKLQAEGAEVADGIEVGIMIEVPAAALSADLFAREADFFSIGTNDLIQYTMAADRMNETVSYLYQPCHPSILRLIRMVIEAASREGKWVGMCGEMAGDRDAIPILLGLGLHEFSMSAGSILPAREQIARLSNDEWTRWAEEAVQLTSQQEIQQYVRQHTQGGITA
jgi:phosphotransferase system enzyme I (PtsI)